MVTEEEHFRGVNEKYCRVLEDSYGAMYANIRNELDRQLTGIVLDIGNGGVFNYSLDRLEKVIAVDLVLGDERPEENVQCIAADVRRLADLDIVRCDTILLQFLLHHVTARSMAETRADLLTILRNCRGRLKEGGRLVVVEMTINPMLELLQNVVFPVVHTGMALFGKPAARFYSQRSLGRMIQTAGFGIVESRRIAMDRFIDPFPAIIPGIVKIPSCLCPTQCNLITACAQGADGQ